MTRVLFVKEVVGFIRHQGPLADVRRYANTFHALGVRRTDGVALLAPNCDELITATLAAELAGIAAPINSGLSAQHVAELLRRSGARILVAAGPDLAPEVWESALELAVEAGMEALLALSPTGVDPDAAKLIPIDGVHVGHLSTLAAQQPADRFVGEPPSVHRLRGPLPLAPTCFAMAWSRPSSFG